MHASRSLSLGALAALTASAGLTGCGSDGAEPAAAQARIDVMVPALVNSTSSAMTSAEGIPSVTWLDQSLTTLDTAFPVLQSLTGSSSGDGGSQTFVLAKAAKALKAEDAALEDPGVTLANGLKQLVFNEDSYEGDGYYRLRGASVCESDGTVDAECAAQIDDAQIRFSAVVAGEDGLDIALAIGPQRAEPLTLELRPDRVSLALDLGAARDAIAFLAGDQAELPEVMEGVLALSLIVHGQDDVSIEAAVREAVRVDALLPGMDEPFRLSTAAKDPVFAVRMNGPASELTWDLDLGRTDLSMPWSQVSTNAAGRLFSMSLGGMSASTTLRADATAATITNIGLGDGTTTLKVDDHTLVAIDLNADAGRRYDLTIEPSESGMPTLLLDPGFDLSVAFDLQPLADAGDLVESYMLSETYRIALTGDAPAIQPVEASLDGSFAGGLRVTGGTLEISSSSAESVVLVETGMCLSEVAPAADVHPVIGALSAAACPE